MVWYVVLGFGFLMLMVQAAPPAEHNGRSFRNALNQQGLQTILQSIEERLRNLDQVYSMRYASPAPDIVRKIEILENKLSRMETQVQTQLDKIFETLNSKNFKDDLTKDQLFRKMDSVYEKINHKLSYLEGKVDMDVLKLQTKIEAGISKIERLDHSFSVRQADMEAEVSNAVEIMENVKNTVLNVENKLMNVTRNTIESSFDKQTNFIQEKFDNVTHLLTQITRTNTSEQCNQRDVLNDFTTKDTQLTKTFKGYEDQIQSYGNKVNNMYNELWKKSTTIENTIKNSVLLMNITRKEIQDLKKTAGHKSSTPQGQADGQLEMIVDSFTNTIQRKFGELGRKVESNFENVMLVQNLFLESCHRIQMDEAQLENKISAVLEKLLDAVTNRSINTFKEIQSMEELIKSHDTNIYRTLNQNTNTIIKLSEKTSEDRKKLEKILSTIRKDIGNALETIQNEISSENHEHSQRFNTVANILLELQEQVNDLDSRVNEDNINYNAKQILQDILVATKSLLDKDTFAERLNVTILPNIQDISHLMTNIYHLLITIDTKINNSYLEGAINSTNITKVTAKQNEKPNIFSVTEPVDVVLEILPEEKISNKSLSRFNYTLITNESDDNNETENTTTSFWNWFLGFNDSNTTNDDESKNFLTTTINYESDEITTTKIEKPINPFYPFFVFDYDSNIPEPSTVIYNKEIITTPKTQEEKEYTTTKSIFGDVPIASTVSVVSKSEIITTPHTQEEKADIKSIFGDVPIASTVSVVSKAEETVYSSDTPGKNETNNSLLAEENDASIKEIKEITPTQASKNENNGIIINSHEISTSKVKNSYVSGSTIADIQVSDSALKRIKIESVTKETTDEILESTTNPLNSFEYTDLKNNTNEENIRDEYEWDYEY